MTELQKQEYFAKYNERTHLVGRIGLLTGLLMMLAVPFAVGAVLGAMPDMGAFWKGFAQVAIVYIPSCIVEFLIYTPMLGAGGSYLAFITGNLINMKIPCAINARDIVDAKAGTPENEIVSTLSIATSSLVTTLVITVGVLLLIPLQPVLEMPELQPAFNNVVPALFGAMATKYFRKGKKLVAIPLTVMTLLFIFVPSLISSVGFLMIVSGAICIAHAFLLFRKETRAAAQAADGDAAETAAAEE
ncbi:MAG: hypothetical protein IJ412_02055 [Oscillospiraceae bacterium]|nr:hypothetical protein [Oscillospiraceae bacterium]